MEKRWNIIAIMMGCVLMISLILHSMTLFKINKMTEQLGTVQQVEMHFNDVKSQLHGISWETEETLEQFKEKQLWVQDANYEINQVDVENETVAVTFQWQLRELADGENVAFLYKDKNSNKWEELFVESNGGLNYSVAETLPLLANYETQVIATSKTGKRSEELVQLNIKDQLDNRFEISTDVYTSRKGIYEINIDVYSGHYDELIIENGVGNTIKSATALFLVNGKEVETYDLTDIDPNMESFQQSRTIDLTDKADVDLDKIRTVELKVIIEDEYGFLHEQSASL